MASYVFGDRQPATGVPHETWATTPVGMPEARIRRRPGGDLGAAPAGVERGDWCCSVMAISAESWHNLQCFVKSSNDKAFLRCCDDGEVA